MKKIYLLLVLSLLIVTLVACNEDQNNSQELPNSEFVEYGVAGEIVEIKTEEKSDNMIILVKGDEDNGATYTEGWVTITESTKIYMSEGVDMDALELNMYVNVFFDGPVAESFPVQGTAKQINIIEKDDNNELQTDE
jgi:hypothetical protein